MTIRRKLIEIAIVTVEQVCEAELLEAVLKLAKFVLYLQVDTDRPFQGMFPFTFAPNEKLKWFLLYEKLLSLSP